VLIQTAVVLIISVNTNCSSVVNIVGLGYRLGDQGMVVRLSAEKGELSLLQSVQTASGSHSSSYSKGVGGSFPGGGGMG
jgi:hypothetical protein